MNIEEIKNRINIRPSNYIEKILYNLIVQGSLTNTELKILTDNHKRPRKKIDHLIFRHGISIQTQRCSTYTEYRLIDYTKACQVYQHLIMKRHDQELRHMEIRSLYKEFPQLSQQEIANMFGMCRSSISYILESIF